MSNPQKIDLCENCDTIGTVVISDKAITAQPCKCVTKGIPNKTEVFWCHGIEWFIGDKCLKCEEEGK